MRSPEDWVDLDRLKGHLKFYQDADGVFPGSEQDLTLADCISAAVRWCAAYTSLPLVQETLTIPVAPPPGLDQPLCLPRVVYPTSIAAVRHWPDERRASDGTAVPEQQVGRMERVGSSKDRAPFIRVWPTASWPDAGPGGWEVDVVKDVTYDGSEGDAIAMAVIQCARDFYDAGSVKERRSAAEALLSPFRYKGTGQ